VAFTETFFQWWLGDGLGVVLVGSGILVWGSGEDRRPLASAWGAILLLGTGLLMFSLARTGLPITFLILVGIVIAGALFGLRAVAMASVVAAIAQVLEIATGSGTLIAGISDETALVTIKLRLLVYAVGGLIVAAEAHEARIGGAAAAAAAALNEAQRAQTMVEREVATRLQLALLPEKPLDHPDVEIAFRYQAGVEGLLVGGDWYDVFALPDERIGIAVGDVAGHGLEAAATMGRLRTALSALAPHFAEPGTLLSHLDDYAQRIGSADFATIVYAVLDPGADRLTFASAGHPPLIVVPPEGEPRWLSEGRSQPIRSGPPTVRSEAETQLEPGSLLVAYSDGLVERRGEDLRLGLERLYQVSGRLSGSSPERACDRLLGEMGIDDTPRDDVVVVVVAYKPGPNVV
jgi:serine phosphatase RsbU (regulator of sigma subunit)